MMLTRDKSTAHTIQKGVDRRKLGRWTWLTLRGKTDKRTTVINTYRATNTQKTAMNQLGMLRKVHPTREPEDFWDDDLSELIIDKKELGEVIVIGDFNCDLNEKEGKVSKFFNALGMSMEQDRPPSNGGQPP